MTLFCIVAIWVQIPDGSWILNTLSFSKRNTKFRVVIPTLITFIVYMGHSKSNEIRKNVLNKILDPDVFNYVDSKSEIGTVQNKFEKY